MSLNCQRELFEILDDVAYLNCAYMSPLLRSARAVGEAAISLKCQPWKIRAADFFEDSETARSLFAELIGADADGISIVPSASYGLSIAAANIPIRMGQSIVVLEDQFPSNVYVWRELAKRKGIKIITVPRPADYDWTSAIIRAINAETAIVAIPNCHWTDGSLVRLAQVAERVREVEAALVIDATQSLGAYPLNVNEVQPDFLVAASYKWLLGPYSVGFLYVSPRFREGTPIEFSWITRKDSEDFSGLVEYCDEYQAGARRFDMGERSNFILLPMAITALRQILEWRVEEIHTTLKELTALIEREARELEIEVVPASQRVGHMIGLKIKNGIQKDLAERFAKSKVFVSVRGRSIRVAPHLYNTHRDIERFFDVLKESLGVS